MLTILSAVFANMEMKFVAIIVLVLSFLKFISVAFFLYGAKKGEYFLEGVARWVFGGFVDCCLVDLKIIF